MKTIRLITMLLTAVALYAQQPSAPVMGQVRIAPSSNLVLFPTCSWAAILLKARPILPRR